MRRQSYRYQRTLAHPAEVRGFGFLTGANVRLRFLPAPPGSGVVFVRTDLRPRASIPAHITQVTGTNRRTTLGRPPAQVGLVEHVLAALAGLRIDNCQVELNAPEPPGLDGSAQGFVDALLGAGTQMQPARRAVYAVEETVAVSAGGASLALHPLTPTPLPQGERGDNNPPRPLGERGDNNPPRPLGERGDNNPPRPLGERGRGEGADAGLTVSYFLDYGLQSPIGRQVHTETITPASFASELCMCRTFILESEADELRKQGLGSRTTLSDLLVFGRRGPIANRQRYANEPARHKVLDAVGDLSLLGVDLCGHVTSYRSGHSLNIRLAQTLYTRLHAACPCAAPLAA